MVCALARESAKLVAASAPHPLLTTGPGEHFAGAFSCHLEGLNPKPVWALLAGYSGSLSPSLAPGDVVLASEVRNPNGNRLVPSQENPEPAKAFYTIHRGPIVTSPRLVASATEKTNLGRQTGTLAVDMESYAFATTCNRFGIPWGVVRVVFDSVDDPLHPNMLRWCDSQGRDNLPALAWDLLTSPGWWWRLPGWGRRDHQAGKSLAGAVKAIIQSRGLVRAK